MSIDKKSNNISDIILIVGYNSSNIFIKTEWCNEIISVKNNYINHIKEIWNVEIKTPEKF